MNVLDDLISETPEVRLKALQGIDLNRNCPYSIVSHVFELLEDDTFVEDSLPPVVENDGAMDYEESIDFYPEQAAEGPEGTRVCDAAKDVLLSLKELPGFFLDLVQETMEDINSRGASWLMSVFFDFPWSQPEEAFEELIPLFFSSKSPNVYNFFQNSAFHYTNNLLNQIFFEDYSGYYVFQGLVRSRGDEVRDFFQDPKNREACVDLLVYVNDHYKAEVLWIYLDSLFALQLDKSLFMDLFSRAFERDVSFTALYLALFDSTYLKATNKVLSYVTRMISETEVYLLPVARFLLDHPQEQKEYPLEMLFSCFSCTFWMEHLEKISTTYLQEQLLKTLLERETDRTCRFNILYQMHLRNLVRNKPELISEFWINLEAEMAGMTPPSETGHPLAVLAENNIIPNGYNSFIFKQLKRGTLTPSFALSFWTPSDTAPPTMAFLLAAIEREIIRTKEQWENEKKERKALPQKYYYEDRKAPSSVLMFLDKKWSALLAYLEANHHQRVLQMAQNLLAIPWMEELQALTEHYGQQQD